MQIDVRNLGMTYGTPLFQDLSFVITERDHIGLVGNNGSGKSTLLKCLCGELEPMEGTIVRPRGLNTAAVPQSAPEAMLRMSLRDAVLSALPADEAISNEWRADLCLDTFEAPEELRSRTLRELSGGWQRLALIMRAWMTDPDLVILDEPTNHLDLSNLLRLEAWIAAEFNRTALITVSHDREFLDNTTNRTIFLRSGVHAIYPHPYSRARELLAEDDRADAASNEREAREVQRLRRSAHELRQVGINNRSDAALRKAAMIARRADDAETTMTAVHTEQRRDIQLASRDIASKKLLVFRDFAVTSPSGQPLFRIGELSLSPGERVALLGRNGSGKSTFVRTLANLLAQGADVPGLKSAPSVTAFYMSQDLADLPAKTSISAYIAGQSSDGDARVTARLVNAGFPVLQHGQAIGRLSPGEASRLTLLALRLREPALYLMDEPTNHLDIAGQEQLEVELNRREAATILVSHDRRFVKNVTTRFLAIEDGRLWELGEPDSFVHALETNRSLRQVTRDLVAR